MHLGSSFEVCYIFHVFYQYTSNYSERLRYIYPIFFFEDGSDFVSVPRSQALSVLQTAIRKVVIACSHTLLSDYRCDADCFSHLISISGWISNWRRRCVANNIIKSVNINWPKLSTLISNIRTCASLISPGQNGRHFADDIFRCFFVNKSLGFWSKFHWSLFLGL